MDPNDVAAAVRRAAAGDQDAWNELVDAFSVMLWAVASGFRLGRADTAEVVQSTWLRLVENLDKIKQPEALAGWLGTTARREALRMLRLRAREVVTDEDGRLDSAPADPPPGPEERALTRDRDGRLWSAFERLPDNCRVLLHMLAVAAISYAEVAAALDMPIGSIGPTRSRCLDRLRRLLGDGVAEVSEHEDDEALLAELGRVVSERNAPPPELLASAKNIFGLRTLDAQLAALVHDSLLDDEPALVRSITDVPRTLTFEAGGLTIELEIETMAGARRLVGQLIPADAVALTLSIGGVVTSPELDDFGRFVAVLPAGSSEVSVRAVRSGGAVVAFVAVV